jgi:GT2 family glycosyltransferase
MNQSPFSVIIPQYKTRDMIELCLGSLFKYSQLGHEVIVIDNNSQDESTDYLKERKSIILIENKTKSIGGIAHKEALDLGVERATRPWVLLLHSDTIFIKDSWDIDLKNLTEEENIVGFSSAIRDINPYESRLEKIKKVIKDPGGNFFTTRNSTKNKIMSYCFGIKKDFLVSSNYKFIDCEEDVATDLYVKKIRGQHDFILLGRKFLENILWHTSNTTSILTGQITDPNLIKKFKHKSGQLENGKIK